MELEAMGGEASQVPILWYIYIYIYIYISDMGSIQLELIILKK